MRYHVGVSTEEERHLPTVVWLWQGHLWHPKAADIDLESYLPHELNEAHLLWDEIPAPFAFFDNGEPTSEHVFYQFTVLRSYEVAPSNEELHKHAAEISADLDPLLKTTPEGFGWQLMEDLRQL